MKKCLLIGFVLAVSFAILLTASGTSDEQPAAPNKKLVVHEWGVFMVDNGGKVVKATQQHPNFILKTPDVQQQPEFGDDGPQVAKEPVIYFYTNEKNQLQVSVDVNFTNGAPDIFWPFANVNMVRKVPGNPQIAPPRPELLEKRRDIELRKRPVRPGQVVPQGLMWNFAIQDAKAAGGQLPALKEVDANSWFKFARDVDAANIIATSNGRDPVLEKFLFYEGCLGGYRGVLQIDCGKDEVTITNTSKMEIKGVLFIGEKLSFAKWIDSIPADGTVKFKIEAGKMDVDVFKKNLVDAMMKAGLYEKEANALLNTWKNEFFKEGDASAKLIYFLPMDEYNRLLPITINPNPDEIKRVGLMYVTNIQMGVAEKVADLIKQLGNDEFAVRDKADKALREIGLPALRQLEEAVKNSSDAEIRMRAENILKTFQPAPK